ncbi:MAG: mechanosensitive ion channel family protein, partial [Bacteroidota bacterium]
MNYLQKFYDQAFHWLITYGPKIIIAVIVLLVGQWVLRIFNRWLKSFMESRKINPSVKT